MSLSFAKYHAGGNDFIVIDDRSLRFALEDRLLIHHLCHRRFGIGADGLILLQPSTMGDFRFRIFNADGSEAALCGNGLGCMIAYVHDLGFEQEAFSVETLKEVLSCAIQGSRVSIQLPDSRVLHWKVSIEDLECYVVDTGVPHAVCFVSDLDEYPVETMGRYLRHHPLFALHEGVNVNFVKVGSDGALRIRTYERGVEGETYSCGTGAAAAAFVAYKLGFVTSIVRVTNL